MPRRDDIRSVLVIGSGPIVIGQACEFDYSGTQALRVLKAEGLRVCLVNSNPATIMTDPELADATYVEPITPAVVEQVIAAERPDALLATLGGQTALNVAVALYESGVLERYGVKLIGASIDAIRAGEDRQAFKEIVARVGAESARSVLCHDLDECLRAADELSYPVVVRPSFTMGGAGSGLARDAEQLRRIAGAGLSASPVTEVLLEESVLGWKEYELELMRDRADNVVVVCSIENVDPMGVHTGDSITCAPAMTLTDREYQRMRDVALAVMRAVGVEAGGCNIQFAVDPRTGRLVVIEMNPRVSRSSALASKATGFPIAKIATKLALGYTLDEIPNDITRTTPAAFEPALDYVAVKVPRFAFEKFPGADPTLTTTMKSVGEAMAIGRSFAEALQKALRSLESPNAVFSFVGDPGSVSELTQLAAEPRDGRLRVVQQALRAGATVEDLADATGIDPWFLDQIDLVNEVAAGLTRDAAGVLRAKRAGFSDRQIAELIGTKEEVVRAFRHEHGIRPVYKTVDTCAAEFAATTPYHYSTYELETEVAPSDRPKVIILGSGPNRIGQGIEFDYACCHAAFALSAAGYETVMVNCNPETVSTDYDTSDRLYLEPLTVEDVLEVVHAESAAGTVAGVIVQLGGQTPLGLASALAEAGVPIVGTSPEAIHLAEDRGSFGRVLARAGLPAPRHGVASSSLEALQIARGIGYPVLVRPSYVLGGRGMEIVYDDTMLGAYLEREAEISRDHPVLVDRFLDDAVEIDVDALYDGEDLYLGGVMEHIEEAGIHSGDSACALPPITLGPSDLLRVRESTLAIAEGLGVRGLLNVQYALQSDTLYVLEANPRASRTVPFVSKATAVPLAKAAARVMLGTSISALRSEGMLPPVGDGVSLPPETPIAVKEAVLPFGRFRDAHGHGVDTVLGPEMKSTGEVMGIDAGFGTAYAKSQAAAYASLPVYGRVFVSVANRDKRAMIFPIKRLADLGFLVYATEGTAQVLRRNGVKAAVLGKHSRPAAGLEDCVEAILGGGVDLVINTPFGVGPRVDGYEIRTACITAGVPCVTTVAGAAACVQGIEALVRGEIGVRSLQAWHDDLRAAFAALAAAKDGAVPSVADGRPVPSDHSGEPSTRPRDRASGAVPVPSEASAVPDAAASGPAAASGAVPVPSEASAVPDAAASGPAAAEDLSAGAASSEGTAPPARRPPSASEPRPVDDAAAPPATDATPVARGADAAGGPFVNVVSSETGTPSTAGTPSAADAVQAAEAAAAEPSPPAVDPPPAGGPSAGAIPPAAEAPSAAEADALQTADAASTDPGPPAVGPPAVDPPAGDPAAGTVSSAGATAAAAVAQAPDVPAGELDPSAVSPPDVSQASDPVGGATTTTPPARDPAAAASGTVPPSPDAAAALTPPARDPASALAVPDADGAAPTVTSPGAGAPPPFDPAAAASGSSGEPRSESGRPEVDGASATLTQVPVGLPPVPSEDEHPGRPGAAPPGDAASEAVPETADRDVRVEDVEDLRLPVGPVDVRGPDGDQRPTASPTGGTAEPDVQSEGSGPTGRVLFGDIEDPDGSSERGAPGTDDPLGPTGARPGADSTSTGPTGPAGPDASEGPDAVAGRVRFEDLTGPADDDRPGSGSGADPTAWRPGDDSRGSAEGPAGRVRHDDVVPGAREPEGDRPPAAGPVEPRPGRHRAESTYEGVSPRRDPRRPAPGPRTAFADDADGGAGNGRSAPPPPPPSESARRTGPPPVVDPEAFGMRRNRPADAPTPPPIPPPGEGPPGPFGPGDDEDSGPWAAAFAGTSPFPSPSGRRDWAADRIRPEHARWAPTDTDGNPFTAPGWGADDAEAAGRNGPPVGPDLFTARRDASARRQPPDEEFADVADAGFDVEAAAEQQARRAQAEPGTWFVARDEDRRADDDPEDDETPPGRR